MPHKRHKLEAMTVQPLLGLLSPDRRLALSYAPVSVRPLFAGLYALDGKLAGIVTTAREPVLAQLKLAWWRDQLARPVADRPPGEPVLAALAAWGAPGSALSVMVEGWERLIGDAAPGNADLAEFVSARGAACSVLARCLGADPDAAGQAGRGWALGDLGLLLGPSAPLLDLAAAADWRRPRLNRSLRPLLIHHGLARHSMARKFAAGGPAALLLAMRLGLLGI